jgi:Chondroitin N-acetylgalactosaminyltransferase
VINTAVTRALHLNPGYKFVKLINGYKRFDPTRGIDYLLDLLMETDRVDEKQTIIR